MKGITSMKLVRCDKDKRFPKLGEQFCTYDIISEQRTEKLMQAFVKNRWTYPMTLYVESMSADKEAILSVPLPIKEMRSIKKIIYVTPTGWQREYIPAFVLQIEDEAMLKQTFEELFYIAEQNFLFALTNEPSLFYHGYHLATTSDIVEILSADYDGQGAVFMKTKEELECANM